MSGAAAETSGRLSVLICDDSLGFRSLVRTWLRHDGRFEILPLAAGGEEARALVAEHRPDAIVLDLVLPDVGDPPAFVAELRALHPRLGVLLVSSLHLPALRNAGEASGADAVCSKGSSHAELVDAVHAVASTAAGART